MEFRSIKKLILVAGVISMGQSAWAQEGNSMAKQQNIQSIASGKSGIAFDNRYQGVVGSPYYAPTWLPGSIEVTQGGQANTRVYKDVKLRYDVNANLIGIVIPETKDTLVLNPATVKNFEMMLPPNDAPVKFTRYPEASAVDAKLTDTFFAVLYDGKSDVTKRIAKSLVKADFKGGYSASKNYDEIIDETQYYIVADGKMQKVKLNKKSVLAALPKQEEKIKEYISAQKLALNKEEDLIKVMTYYDTL